MQLDKNSTMLYYVILRDLTILLITMILITMILITILLISMIIIRSLAVVGKVKHFK
jgi:hypothetical protein